MSPRGIPITVVGLGANLGDRLANLRNAVLALADEAVEILGKSQVYESAPAGGPPQPHYLNAAVKLAVPFPLPLLLERCLTIERRFGRRRPDPIRNGPRPLDLDILWWSGAPHETSDPIVPHPRLHLRPFALRPLLDLVPDARDPAGQRYADMDAAHLQITRIAAL